MKNIYRATIGMLLIVMVSFPVISYSAVNNSLVATVRKHKVKVLTFSALLAVGIVVIVSLCKWCKNKRVLEEEEKRQNEIIRQQQKKLRSDTLSNFVQNKFFF